MGIPLLLNLWRMRRCILEGCLFQTFPGSRRHVLNLKCRHGISQKIFLFILCSKKQRIEHTSASAKAVSTPVF